MKYALAIDIGASSGRAILGYKNDTGIVTEEVYRFPNGVQSNNSHLTWDMDTLFTHVKKGIDIALQKQPNLASVSIDTWGVDYVLLKENKEILPVYAYRDERTLDVIDEVHRKIPFEKLYARTGCQFQPFNTIYQLYKDQITGRLDGVTDFLMIPEYLMYKLTNVKVKEYTNATTTGLIHATAGDFDPFLIDTLGLPRHLFSSLKKPGDLIGTYRGINVVLCATHDTASAVEGIPMPTEGIYLSSGTWSLLGVKTKAPIVSEESRRANFSNEGGVGYNRYQKNIMGMWLINRLRSELCPNQSFERIVEEAKNSTFEEIVPTEDSAFLSPSSMKDAFDSFLKKDINRADYFRCAYRSLAYSYKSAIRQLEETTGNVYDTLYIVGGGAKNAFLNRLTEEITHKKVVAYPLEATALGNLKLQLEEVKNNAC